MVNVKPKEMKVKDLVKVLLKCDQEAYVCLGWCDCNNADIDICIGVEEEYEESSEGNVVTIGSEEYFNFYDEDE